MIGKRLRKESAKKKDKNVPIKSKFVLNLSLHFEHLMFHLQSFYFAYQQNHWCFNLHTNNTNDFHITVYESI